MLFLYQFIDKECKKTQKEYKVHEFRKYQRIKR